MGSPDRQHAAAMASRDQAQYNKVLGGKLKMKGLALETKKKKRKRHREEAAAGEQESEEPQHGAGSILSNATSVMGKDSVFSECMQSGDCLLVMHPTTLAYETRTIKAVLSNVSLLLSEPFSSDLISYTDYQYIINPHARQEKIDDQNQKIKKEKKEKREAGRTFTYQTKAAGAWGTLKTVTEKLSHTATKSTLLDMRCKKVHDRHC